MATIAPTSVYPAKLMRSAAAASRIAFWALLLRDLTVLKKNLGVFIARTLIQPFLLVFVFLYVFPIASVVHAPGVEPQLSVHWLILLTLIPLTSIMTSSFGLVLGTRIEPRNIGVMFGFIILPITFLGGTYYPWTALGAIKVGGFPGCKPWSAPIHSST